VRHIRFSRRSAGGFWISLTKSAVIGDGLSNNRLTLRNLLREGGEVQDESMRADKAPHAGLCRCNCESGQHWQRAGLDSARSAMVRLKTMNRARTQWGGD